MSTKGRVKNLGLVIDVYYRALVATYNPDQIKKITNDLMGVELHSINHKVLSPESLTILDILYSNGRLKILQFLLLRLREYIGNIENKEFVDCFYAGKPLDVKMLHGLEKFLSSKGNHKNIVITQYHRPKQAAEAIITSSLGTMNLSTNNAVNNIIEQITPNLS